jgi:hypothetical protein
MNFLGEFFWGGFFGGFFGRIFWEDFFGRNCFRIYLLVKVLVFVKILYLRKGRKEGR